LENRLTQNTGLFRGAGHGQSLSKQGDRAYPSVSACHDLCSLSGHCCTMPFRETDKAQAYAHVMVAFDDYLVRV
ncbi:hypothetical protein, partial [Roseobacter sp. OBYS 0001]|uniref:hypothetical protein n=1 Tax=Roseobacter sp. OBYS 0001 TaxID=882651 RepID=UPI001C80AE8B